MHAFLQQPHMSREILTGIAIQFWVWGSKGNLNIVREGGSFSFKKGTTYEMEHNA